MSSTIGIKRSVTCLHICCGLTALDVCLFVNTAGELMKTQPINGCWVTGAKVQLMFWSLQGTRSIDVG